jgi:hypothetical protein
MKQKTQNEPENTDLLTDDEALREAGMRSGPRKLKKWKFRACVPGTVSIIRSNMLDNRDSAWYVAAYAFVHTAPLEDVIALDGDRAAFNRAVRKWQFDNLATKQEEEELSAIVSAEYELVNASETKAQHQSPESTISGK